MDARSVFFYSVLAITISLLAGFLTHVIISRRKTVPSGKWEGFEGFHGGSLGVPDIACSEESSDAVAICDLFDGRKATTSEGPDDLRELKVILSKLCCAKKDLSSSSQSVNATLKMSYNTSHDREPVANTVARCFTRTIPMRDIDITFLTWKDRGNALLNKLCTSYNLSNDESERAKKFFMACLMETFSLAKEVSSRSGSQTKESDNPRDLRGLMAEKIRDLGVYTGYY